jgi:tol-pal system protein YbgF
MTVLRRALVITMLVLGGGALLAPAALAANKEMQALQAQITNLQGQIADLQRALEDNVQGIQREMKRLSDLVAEANATQKRAQQDQRLRDEAVQSSLRDMSDRLSELREKFQTMPAAPAPAPTGADPLAPAPTPPAAGASVPAAPGASPSPAAPLTPTAAPPRELYSQAYADFARGNYDLAIQGFQEYVKNYKTDFTDNAQYWIGECYYGKQQFQESVDALSVLQRDYPTSDKLPDAHVKKGLALEKLGRRSEAVREYRIVIDRYPSAPAARIAREKLATP